MIIYLHTPTQIYLFTHTFRYSLQRYGLPLFKLYGSWSSTFGLFLPSFCACMCYHCIDILIQWLLLIMLWLHDMFAMFNENTRYVQCIPLALEALQFSAQTSVICTNSFQELSKQVRCI